MGATMIENRRGMALFVDELFCNGNAPSVIFCCTPLVPVVRLRRCYAPFVRLGFNVYALDFAGTGRSGGTPADLTTQGILDDLDSLVAYAAARASGGVYLFADGGIGGIIGQFYASGKTALRGFAQFAVANYAQTGALGVPAPLARLCLPLLAHLCRLAPNLALCLPPPAYHGHHATLDNAFYRAQLKGNRRLFWAPLPFLHLLLEVLVGAHSQIRQPVPLPTLVFKTTCDRYFPASYFDDYFARLPGRKKLVTVRDVHNSYALYPRAFARAAGRWFWQLEATNKSKPHG